MNILPINLDDLIQARTVESIRLEFKKSWTQPTMEQVMHTICAFANDLADLNGGYLVIGIEEMQGRAILPPIGLEEVDLDEMQKQIFGLCKNLTPEVQPIISPERYQGRQIMVIWAPAGDLRPYHAPKSLAHRDSRVYYVRHGSMTVEAKGEMLTQLMQKTAKVPFDDRRNLEATIHAISPMMVRNFLTEIKSGLVAPDIEIADLDIYRNMRLLAKVNGHEVPRNVALMFFANDPELYFRGARIEVVQFSDDEGGDLIDEKIFRGPLHVQLRQVIDYLSGLNTTLIQKVPDQAEAIRTSAYPLEAVEESVVNAVYHRSYEGMPEPIRVYIYPNRMEIVSFPGPLPGIDLRHFQTGGSLLRVQYRNRRIGEFLKELRLTEGRGTGITKIRRQMQVNGSPAPIFDFDEARSYFCVILPAHPRYVITRTFSASNRLWASDKQQEAIQLLERAIEHVPDSGVLYSGVLYGQLIDYYVRIGNLSAAEQRYTTVQNLPLVADWHLPAIAMARGYLDFQEVDKAATLLSKLQAMPNNPVSAEVTALAKRLKQYQTGK